jgi:transposase
MLTLWSPDAGALFFSFGHASGVWSGCGAASAAEVLPPIEVELRLRRGRSLHFESMIDPSVLSVLIRAVDGA